MQAMARPRSRRPAPSCPAPPAAGRCSASRRGTAADRPAPSAARCAIEHGAARRTSSPGVPTAVQRMWWPQWRADLQRPLKILVKDHLLARRALVPEIVRHLALPEQGAEARPDRRPRSANSSGGLHAAHTVRQPPHLVEHPAHRVRAVARPSASRLAASVSISADADHGGVRRHPRPPPPAPVSVSRTRSRSADPSQRRTRGIAAARLSAEAAAAPVIPVMLT